MKKPASKIPAGKVQAYADTNGLPPGMPDNSTRETVSPAPEIETAEWLAKQGWERVSFVFECDQEANGDDREAEILTDPDGGFWLVTNRSGKGGITYGAERRRITREAAVARMARAMIPHEVQGDFRECLPPKLRLETAIQEARAFLFLMSEPAAEFRGERGESIQAGIASLSLRLGDELAAAFYAAEDAA